MSQIDNPVQNLKDDLDSMFNIVHRQLAKAKDALVRFDKDLAREVGQSEKRVNSLELQIDRSAENFIALYSPVAIDLRFVLAVLKINSNLERIGDIADGISKYVIESKGPLDKELILKANVIPMYEAALVMVNDVKTAFEKEDTSKARKVFESDEYLDHINIEAIKLLTNGITQNPEKIEDALYIISIIRKLERIGDQVKNIAEEIIFYIEAKVIKHSSEKK